MNFGPLIFPLLARFGHLSTSTVERCIAIVCLSLLIFHDLISLHVGFVQRIMEESKKADFEPIDSRSYGPIVEILKKTVTIAAALIIQFFLYLDLIIQRLANVVGLSRLS